MNFYSSTDFEAPIDQAFRAFSDFEGFERHGMRMGADVERVDDLTEIGRGMMWKVKAEYRGKPRKIDLELVDFEPSQFIEFKAVLTGLEGGFQIDLVSLSPSRTRAKVNMNVKPTSLSARLMVQSARLTKASLTKKFSTRISNFCSKIEEDFQSSVPG